MEIWEERDYRRNEIIRKAIDAADRIILDGSDGSNEETNYLTAMVAQGFFHKAILPMQSAIQKKDFEEGENE